MNKEENEVQAIFKFYDTTRQEINVRITARDNTLLVYLGGVAAVIGASIKGEITIQFLLIIPYIALGISLIVANHHRTIAMLSTYCASDLQRLMKKYGIYVPQLEGSLTMRKFLEKRLGTRFLGDLTIINVPSIFAIAINVVIEPSKQVTVGTLNHTTERPFILICFASCCLVVCIWVLWRAYKLRQKLRMTVREYYESEM